MTYAELRDELQRGVELIDALFGEDAKYTKANSKRLRDVLNNIKKNAATIRKQLVEEDKAR